jgi:hypothetical protein
LLSYEKAQQQIFDHILYLIGPLVFLHIKELLLCGQVSQRLRAISNDGSLWRKLNLYRGQDVPYDFIKKALENGCQYLSLAGSGVLRLTEKSESSFNLKYVFKHVSVGTIISTQKSKLSKIAKNGTKL